ncbi:MAG: hypothetical protein OEM24_05580 [Paracoccaceae bacterium]|nr:hypothetical protein [Paracoccaceae bacterium]
MTQADLNTVALRMRAVEQEMARHHDGISACEAELAELRVAEKVLARLSGAKRPEAGEDRAEKEAATPSTKPEGIPAMTEMILAILRETSAAGMEPKDIASVVRERWWPDVDGVRVSTAAWQLWKRGELEKDEGSSLYRLPQEKEPSDKMPGEASEGSLFQPNAQGREAEPGGGT